LWYDVQVTNRCKEVPKLSKVTIDIHLFKIRLSKTLRIFLIRLIRSIEYNSIPAQDPFSLDDRTPTIVLVEDKFVLPGLIIRSFLYGRVDHYIGILTSGQAPKHAYTPATGYCFLKTSSRCGEIAQKAKNIEEVRFTCCIRSNKKASLL